MHRINLCVAFFFLCIHYSNADIIYVGISKVGEGNGSLENPFLSISQALQGTRSFKEKKKRIHIKDPITLYLKETIRLDERDSFLEISGVKGSQINGGKRVQDWRKTNDGLWLAKCPTGSVPRELFLNGTALQRARFPDSGWLRIEKSLPDRRSGFWFRKNELPSRLKNSTNLELLFLHDWSISRMPVREIDFENSILYSKFPIGCSAPHYAIDHFEKNPRYALVGSVDLIDKAGEWAFNKGKLFYKPYPKEKIAESNFVIPHLEQLLLMQPSETDKSITNLKISGITFSVCRFDLPIKGYASGQATIHEHRDGSGKSGRKMMPTAVRLAGTFDSSFQNCKFTNLGGSGLWVGRNCRNITITDSLFENIAGNGINIGETDQHLPARNVEILNSQVQRCGNQFYGSVGIWLGMAENCKIERCEISQLPYTGISLGWKWDDTPTVARNHKISNNHIHHVMQILSDGGGIYTLGRQPGSILSENQIHHIPLNAGRAQSNGIFMDQGSSAFTVRNNTIHHIAKSPIRFHKAKENLIKENALGVGSGEEAFTFNSTPKELIAFENNKVTPNKDLTE